jgi:hypothetical protein
VRIGGVGNRLPPSLRFRGSGEDAHTEDAHADYNRDGVRAFMTCPPSSFSFPGAEVTGASECLNGSLVYLPALLAMAIVGGLLAEQKHPAAPFILWAALIFAISVTFRSLDLALCGAYHSKGATSAPISSGIS